MSRPNRQVLLKKEHAFKDFLYWTFVSMIPIFAAGLAIGLHSTKWLLIYLFLLLFHFFVLEYRFFCSYCPYYRQNGSCTKCMLVWGWPKYFKSRPNPPGRFDIAITTLGFLVGIFFPLSWLLKAPFLLAVYFVSISFFLLTVRRYECVRCIYFGCPFNRVPAEVKKEFESNEKFEMSEWKI